jgi:hypothetical protein
MWGAEKSSSARLAVPVLGNPRHERFARTYVEQALVPEPPTSIALAAFEKTGYEPSICNAGRLRNNPQIKARIDELMTEALEYSWACPV